MHAVRLMAKGDLRLAAVPDPEPAPGEVLVRVEAAGICGTDRHLFHGDFPSRTPVTLGHEFSGTVLAGTLPVGTRVSCNPNIACGLCADCRRGRVNLCPHNIAIGIHRDGGFAEYATMPPTHAHILPPDLPRHHGAFCEPLACTLHGLDLGAPRPGERVVVLGGGVIGLLALQLAKAAGAEVLLVTRQASKRDLAVELGATHATATPSEVLAIWPDGADLVLECAGVAETVEAAPRITRRGGRVVILGVLPQGQQVRIEPFDLLFREVRLLASFINPFTQSRATQMIADGSIRLAPLISRVISVDEAVRCISNPPLPGEVKVIIEP